LHDMFSSVNFGYGIAFLKGMKVLMIHPEKCTGCQNCMLACSLHHEGQFRMAASRIHVYTWEREGISVPMMCQQCDTAACMKVCPTAALHRAPGELLVDFSQSKCIGCHMCTIACPFGNIAYDAVAGSPLKCDTCGGDPSCVRYCPTQALEWVDDTVSMRNRKKNYAAKFKEAFGEATV
jgi:anaerobic carbon-monoxide dehydrogenase iron sulfur subunit